MPPRRTRNINDVYERIMARMEERLDQFVDQFANRMNDMMNPKRRGDRNGRRNECEESENSFFKGEGSSSFVELEEWEGNGVADENYDFPGQMTYPVASLTLDSARSYVMQGTPFTKRLISSIPIGGSISPEGFLPSIILMVFMVTVVIVAVILVVVVVVIFWVVVVIDGVSSIIKLSFMIIGFLRIIVFYYLLHQPLGYGNGFLQSLRL
ncbi:hypothetical protein Tco_0209753 [Tanacetum coccineum]